MLLAIKNYTIIAYTVDDQRSLCVILREADHRNKTKNCKWKYKNCWMFCWLLFTVVHL